MPVPAAKSAALEAPPEVLSAFVLERLKQDTERRLGPIRQVVITVPAFFDEDAAQGHSGRRTAGPSGSARHHQRAHGGGTGLWTSTRIPGPRRRTPRKAHAGAGL